MFVAKSEKMLLTCDNLINKFLSYLSSMLYLSLVLISNSFLSSLYIPPFHNSENTCSISRQTSDFTSSPTSSNPKRLARNRNVALILL